MCEFCIKIYLDITISIYYLTQNFLHLFYVYLCNTYQHDIFCLEYIPDFNEIEKTESNFYTTSTVGEIMYGDKSRNTTTVNIYRNSQEPFVLVHNLTDDHEYIHKLNDEGQLQEGIYRYKFPWGDTEIGCRLFWRGDRQEDKVFRLYKFSSSGEIRYFEQVWGNEDKSYRTVTEYMFHPDTLSWSNVEIDD